MTQYLAFLRGINVGGRNLVKMSDLRETFLSLGLLNVKTYIQSGNVRFEAQVSNPGELEKMIESHIQKELGINARVMARTFKHVEHMIELNPFGDLVRGRDVKLYVCFLERVPVSLPVLPLVNQKEGLEVKRIIESEAYVVSREIEGTGRFGFPNSFIEKELGLISTARNWETVKKIAGVKQ